MANSIQFDQSFFNRLAERTEYELWFLEAVYDLAGKPLFPTWPDTVVYFPNETKPTITTYGCMNIVLGDWRSGFLSAGSPLVFVTTFKLLDMFIDLVLEENGTSTTFRFEQKISKLKNNVIFPDFIESRFWLKERIIGLYETIEPLRGTIIHDKHFQAVDGNLKVSSSKRGVVGPERTIDSNQLRDLSILVISIIHYVDGSWRCDPYKEKVLRRTLDILHEFHTKPLLGQLTPTFLTVRQYVKQCEKIKIDMKRIRDDLKQRYSNEDVVFDLRIIIASNDPKNLTPLLLSWGEIEKHGDELILGPSEISKYNSAMPEDIKKEEVFQKLQ